MSKQEELLPGGVSQEQINKWKKQHGQVFAISIPLDDEGKEKATGYFRKPNLDIVSAANKVGKTDMIRGGLVAFESTFLGGDPIIKEDDEVKMSAIEAVGQLFKVREAEVKNL